MSQSNFEVIVFDHKENKEIIKKRLSMKEVILLFAMKKIEFNEEDLVNTEDNKR